jgi:hypothetical protein
MERLVLWRLEETTFKIHPIHRNQHAFRRGHSTEIPLSKLTNFVEQAFINKEYAVCVFLDIIGAFNNVTHTAIIRAMKDSNFPPEIINWYGNYTQTRSCEIKIGSKTFIRYLIDGTSQGGILSPVIFNLVINILHTHTPPLEIFIQGEFISAYTRTKTFVNPDNTYTTRDTLASHIAWAEKLSENAEISNIPTDITTPFFHWLHKWKITLENYNTYNEARPNKLQIFTDGSHIKQPDNTGVTGCGYAIVQFDTEKNDYFPSHVESIYLGKMATIFQAEVHAI